MRTLHSLKAIAVDTFESCKAELKDNDKSGYWFSPLQLHVFPEAVFPFLEITQTDIRNTLTPPMAYKNCYSCHTL